MKTRKAALTFILITVALDMIALGIIIPVLPTLILSFLGGNAPRAAYWLGIFATVFALMQFFFMPVLGVISDRVGRRPVILLSNVGLGLDYFVMALAPSIGWLFVGRIISGITAASVTTAMAYISDVVVPEKRAGAFGMIGAAFGLGFIVGPALGGWLGATDPRLPFWVAGALSLLNAAYGFFILPDRLGSSSARLSRFGARIPLARSFCCVRIRNCSAFPRFNSSATRRTRWYRSMSSTPSFVMSGRRKRSDFPSPLSVSVPS
jgi:DHA1 family tetracycline resistance protein-like MFS transporter